MAVQGKITFNIARFSILGHDKWQCSEEVKIGKHFWGLLCQFKELNSTMYLSVYCFCNAFITESSWSANVKFKMWLRENGEQFKVCCSESRTLNINSKFYGWNNFIAKNCIPRQCIIDDTLTIETEIEILKEEKPSVSFGSPGDIQAASYEEIMKDQDHKLLFNNEISSNIVFVVGPKVQNTQDACTSVKIFGHQSVIAMSSSVFSTMIFPSESSCLTRKQDEEGRLLIEIHDPETHPTALLSLLRFTYTKELVVDRQLIYETLYLAEKYDMKHFVELMGYLLSAETVTAFLPFVVNVGNTHLLYKRCEFIIQSQTKLVIDSDSFLEMENELVKFILSNPFLQIRELDLFNRYVDWADYQLLKQGIIINDENRRKIMKHLNQIRFPIMTLEEFSSGPAGTNILTGDEKSSIFRYFTIKSPTIFLADLRNF